MEIFQRKLKQAEVAEATEAAGVLAEAEVVADRCGVVAEVEMATSHAHSLRVLDMAGWLLPAMIATTAVWHLADSRWSFAALLIVTRALEAL